MVDLKEIRAAFLFVVFYMILPFCLGGLIVYWFM